MYTAKKTRGVVLLCNETSPCTVHSPDTDAAALAQSPRSHPRSESQTLLKDLCKRHALPFPPPVSRGGQESSTRVFRKRVEEKRAERRGTLCISTVLSPRSASPQSPTSGLSHQALHLLVSTSAQSDRGC